MAARGAIQWTVKELAVISEKSRPVGESRPGYFKEIKDWAQLNYWSPSPLPCFLKLSQILSQMPFSHRIKQRRWNTATGKVHGTHRQHSIKQGTWPAKTSYTAMKQERLSDRYNRLCLGLSSGRCYQHTHARAYHALFKNNKFCLRHNETQNFLVFPKTHTELLFWYLANDPEMQ